MPSAIFPCLFFVFRLIFSFTAVNAFDVSLTLSSSSPLLSSSGLSLSFTLDMWPNAKTDYGNKSWVDAGLFQLDFTNKRIRNLAKQIYDNSTATNTNTQTVLRVGGTLADHIVYNMSSSSSSSSFSSSSSSSSSSSLPLPCVPIYSNSSNPTTFSGGCLNLTRWKQLHAFCHDNDNDNDNNDNDIYGNNDDVYCRIVFSISSLYGGREDTPNNKWDPSNAESLISASASLGLSRSNTLFGFELGNEVAGSSGLLAKLPASEYAYMFSELYDLLCKYYPDADSRPHLIGPDQINGVDVKFVLDFTRNLTAFNVPLYAYTYHNYLLAGVDERVDSLFVNATWLQGELQKFVPNMQTALEQANREQQKQVQLWMGETGGAYNSGRNTISNAFEGSFWYLYEVGLMSTHNHSNFCRQALIGGNYGLISLNSTTSTRDDNHDNDDNDDNDDNNVVDLIAPFPNPDYFSALLARRLISDRAVLALDVVVKRTDDDDNTRTHTDNKMNDDDGDNVNDNVDDTYGLRAFAYCDSLPSTSSSGGVVLMLLNFNASSNATITLSIISNLLDYDDDNIALVPRFQYVLSGSGSAGSGSGLQSRIVSLNGVPVVMGNGEDDPVPTLNPEKVDGSEKLVLGPHQIAFVQYPNANFEPCMQLQA